MIKTYTPQFIGSWYNNNYLEQVNSFLFKAPKENARAIIVPHAGYKYSGSVLGDVYSRINFENIDKIILLCAFHKNSEGLILPLFTKIKFSNPSNELLIDTDSINLLSKYSEFKFDDDNYYNEEHAFEMQLPFIIRCVGNKNVKLLPILVGRTNSYETVAKKLVEIIDENTLIIVSSDFTHYGPNYNIVDKNITSAKRYILINDFTNFKSIIDNDINNFIGKSVCGKNAILLLMHISKFNLKSKLVSYETSADNENDRFDLNSVSYAGFIFAKQIKKNNLKKIYTTKKIYINLMQLLESKNKIILMKLLENNKSLIPRFTLIILSKIYSNRDISNISVDEMYNDIMNHLIINDDDNEKYGIFVTFEDFTKLQGCIGVFYDNNNLSKIKSIIMYTLKTIFGDDRFPQTRLNSNKNVPSFKYYKYLYTSDSYNFKINYLSKNFEIPVPKFWDIYVPCMHGIILRYKSKSATFLPMVMLDQGWIKKCDGKLTRDIKKFFEKNTFGALINKMGLLDNWKNWREGNIFLYEGNEINEYF